MSRKIGFLICATMTLACGLVLAAPSLPITKAPVTPNPSSTGPTNDANAIMGQWFVDLATSNFTYRTHELYDNPTGMGGGNMGHLAISGRVTNIEYYLPPINMDIVSFDVEATVWNDTPAATNWTSGTNNLDEALSTSLQHTNTLLQVVVSVDFATAEVLPSIFAYPFVNPEISTYITATNHDYRAWYEYSAIEGAGEPTGYFVPGWNFGNIPAGQYATRTFHFVIKLSDGTPQSMPTSDPRYDAINDSYNNNTDIFINRSLSLKISEWISDPASDTGDGGATNSNVSVFHNTDEDVNQGVSITSMTIQPGLFTLNSRGCTNGINPQILQTCTNLITTNWVDVATNTAAWPLPQTNSWSHSNAIDSIRFYRIIQP